MKKFLNIFFLSILIFILFSIKSQSFAEFEEFEENENENENLKLLPLSPAFLKWREEFDNNKNKNDYIPLTLDLSYLAENPPSENSSIWLDKASTIPEKYDLRTNHLVSSAIKNQLPYGVCWAFASIGAMESNYIKQGNPEIDLSEMHLAWFALKNSDKSKAFENISGSDIKKILDNGGNIIFSTSIYSRLDGPVLESSLPYSNNIPSLENPTDYKRVLRLRDVYYFTPSHNIDSHENIKRRIMEHGAVQISFYSDPDAKYYKNNIDETTSYYEKTRSTNHAVLIVGWDDNYPISNFRLRPSSPGAWLIKNSWGNKWYNADSKVYVGNEGYFWMSYQQFITEGAAFVVENADYDMKCYYYDALGWIATTDASYGANIFLAERDEEKLKEVGFYAPDNNINYEIKIYTGLNSLKAKPTNGTLALTQNGTISTAGYHTITLDEPVELEKNKFFSIVLSFNVNKMPVETKIIGYTPNAVIDEGSFFSSNGKSWTKGTSKNFNACIKAFTVTNSGPPSPPKITTTNLTNGIKNNIYSYTFKADGTKPIEWSISNSSLPDDFKINQEGVFSGTSLNSGTFYFTVNASNYLGSDSKNIVLTINEGISIKTETLSGTQGYSFNAELETENAIGSVEWEISENTSLPDGIKLNSKTGILSGKPTVYGTFYPVFKATDSNMSVSKTIEILIEQKPVKPKISTSSFKNAVADEFYESDALKITGTEPITITALNGIPEGLSFNPKNLTLSGTPSTSGNFYIKFKAENKATNLENKTITKNVKLVVKAKTPVISSQISDLPDGIKNEKYENIIFKTSYGSEPIKWTASNLPPGLKISTEGILSGTPTKTGTFNPIFKASNSAGKDTKKLAINIIEKPVIKTKSIKTGKTDKKYSATISANGTKPLTWEISGLPENFTIKTNDSKGNVVISGIPTEMKNYKLKVTARNSAGEDSKELSMMIKGVAPKLKVKLAKGVVGTYYDGSVISTSGTKPLTLSCSASINSTMIKSGYSNLESIGLSFTYDENSGNAKITGTPKISFNNLPIIITASNVIKSQTKKSSLTISERNTENSSIKYSYDSSLPTENEQNQQNFENIQIVKERDSSSLSSGEIFEISDEGLIIAAILPEMNIINDGIYDFEISLDHKISKGSELIWRSNPNEKNNELVNFYDYLTGEEIKFIPESYKIIASTWLDSGTYEPLILAKPNNEISIAEKNNNDETEESFSGGCNNGFNGLMLLIFVLVNFIRNKKVLSSDII